MSLPPLPEATLTHQRYADTPVEQYYSADQLIEYGKACAAAERDALTDEQIEAAVGIWLERMSSDKEAIARITDEAPREKP